MRTYYLTVAAAACSLALHTAAAEHKSQWYLSLAGGANFADLQKDSTSDYDTGWDVIGTLGYKFSNRLRLEAEIGYRTNEGTARDFAPALIAGTMEQDLSALSFMGNALFEIPLTERVNISLGGGAGATQVGLDVNAPFTPDSKDKDTVFAWQLLAQADFAISRRTELYVDYHFLQTVNDLNLRPYSTALYGSRSMQYEAHSLSVGLRYYFGEHEEEVAPAAPPPPPPAPPPVVKQFIVFFGFNKSNLSAEAQAVVAEAAAAAKAQGSARIAIAGHTDTVGSSAYNDQLSLRRANAVKDELTRLGISADAISASGKGETELMVQTGDGVKEPQNRRATINLN